MKHSDENGLDEFLKNIHEIHDQEELKSYLINNIKKAESLGHSASSIRMLVAMNPHHDPSWWINDSDMMYFYYQLNNKERLPDSLHNSMLALSLDGDEKANKYLDDHC